MKITKAMIDKAKRKGACADAIKWLREKRRTLKELYEYNPDWMDWAAVEGVITWHQAGAFWPVPRGMKVELTGNTAVGERERKLKKGMRGKVCTFDSSGDFGIDLGPKFNGHDCGGSLDRPTGYYFNRDEFRVIRKGKR